MNHFFILLIWMRHNNMQQQAGWLAFCKCGGQPPSLLVHISDSNIIPTCFSAYSLSAPTLKAYCNRGITDMMFSVDRIRDRWYYEMIWLVGTKRDTPISFITRLCFCGGGKNLYVQGLCVHALQRCLGEFWNRANKNSIKTD